MVKHNQNPTNDLNRLIAAAVIDREFCALLLTNPVRAIRQGYHGECFQLSEETAARISVIKAASLPELARQLIASPNGGSYTTGKKRISAIPKHTGHTYDALV